MAPPSQTSTCAILAITATMLVSGAVNTLTKKWQLQTCTANLHPNANGGVIPSDAVCDDADGQAHHL